MSYVLNTTSAVCSWPVAPANPSIPQWVISKLPVGRNSALSYDNGQWYINGKPARDIPFIKTGTLRKNHVALSVRAALWI